MLKKYFTFSHFTLLVALCISAIAAWYSVLGLTAIFAGAVIPIIIMGSVLEIAKVTTTVWLHRHWSNASLAMRTYLVSAVIALAAITSMGIFGLLSKAHLDQGLVGGDVIGQISIYDEKIKIQRDNIEAARRALGQMDAQVDARLQRGDSEAGAERAVQIRRQQAQERTRLLKDISDAQREITKLTDQRAPLAAQLRKVEAEVGPVKYIAALIYGDNPDAATLERAVRWVIIMIVAVFDPLAIVLILAANNSIRWDRLNRSIASTPPIIVQDNNVSTTEEVQEKIVETNDTAESVPEPVPVQESEKSSPVNYTVGEYTTGSYVFGKPLPAAEVQDSAPAVQQSVEEKFENIAPVNIITEGVTEKIYGTGEEYVQYAGKKMSINALRHLKPGIVVDDPTNKILWGAKFPEYALIDDIYIRVDVHPHQVYKFDGSSWIQINRHTSTDYLENRSYIKYIIDKLGAGEYDPVHLSAEESIKISEYLKQTI